jgi:hypothetical protein
VDFNAASRGELIALSFVALSGSAAAWWWVYLEWRKIDPRRKRRRTEPVPIYGGGQSLPTALLVSWLALMLGYVSTFQETTYEVVAGRLGTFLFAPLVVFALLALSVFVLRAPGFLMAPRFRGWWLLRKGAPAEVEAFFSAGWPASDVSPLDARTRHSLKNSFELHEILALAIWEAGARPAVKELPTHADWENLKSSAMAGMAERSKRLESWLEAFGQVRQTIYDQKWPKDMRRLKNSVLDKTKAL